MKTLKAIGFWLVSFTWGFLMTLAGLLVAVVLIVTGHKPQHFHHFVYFTVGSGWGGFSLGGFIVVSKDATPATLRHECGHGLQNIMLGVLMPFLVSIPSCVRYWYREYLIRSGKKQYHQLPDYDSIWFEGWATSLGNKYYR